MGETTIDLDAVLKSLDGKDILNEGTPLSVKRAAVAVLLAPDNEASAEQIAGRYAAAVKIYEGGEQHVTPEVAVRIRQRAHLVWPPIVAAQLYGIFG